ncbi:MAG: hypothetical protein KKA05_05080 [Alphaproteobacteria bacterium]|nr:hypothetical protein [Alphaproteobacteria bacterium]MBU0858801.1 hypothetical protein [Alphaproteobacteria bacterium]
MNRLSLLAAAAAALLLSGCVDRAAADAQLAKGCEAGVNALLTDDMKITRVDSSSFSASPEGQGFRHVSLKALITDGWAEENREFVCIFEESFGFLNASHTAALYQLRLSPEEIYGKSGKEILGDTQAFIKLNDAIREAMYQ